MPEDSRDHRIGMGGVIRDFPIPPAPKEKDLTDDGGHYTKKTVSLRKSEDK